MAKGKPKPQGTPMPKGQGGASTLPTPKGGRKGGR